MKRINEISKTTLVSIENKNVCTFNFANNGRTIIFLIQYKSTVVLHIYLNILKS